MRVAIPEEVAAEILFRHHHTCCVCQERGKHVQIHHIDDDASNNHPDNLAVVCLECHNDTQISGGFGRRLRGPEVRKYRDEWTVRIAARRARADEIAVQKDSGPTEPYRNETTGQWTPPSDLALYMLIESIPEIIKTAYRLAQKEWDEGATQIVTLATYQVVDVVEKLLIQLAAWYPPNHFGKPASKFFAEHVASRFELRRALIEPEGPGTAGSMIGPMVAYGALLDTQQTLILTVHLLLLFREQNDDFDLAEWEKRFHAATSTYNQ